MNKDDTIKYLQDIKLVNKKKKLLLHVCCAPCTTGVYDQLYDYFDITFLYYNPNTHPKEEYYLRYDNLLKLNEVLKYDILEIGYNPEEFFDLTKGLENEKEGGKRCEVCYKLRLEKTAKIAKEKGFDCFTTTLSVSPYKNADKLNNMGELLENKYGVKYIYSNFKKNDGYKKSIKRSKELNLYRQEYCGCIYSLKKETN